MGRIELAVVQYERDCERPLRGQTNGSEEEASERVTLPPCHRPREQQTRIRPTPMTILRA